MRYIVIEEPYRVMIGEADIPAVGPESVLVRVKTSAISQGTEMHLYKGLHPNLSSGRWGYFTSYPIRPGYQAVGVVEDFGSGVHGLKKGDRVVCFGPHAEYVVVDKSWVVPLPAATSDHQAALAILATTCSHAIRRAGIQLGDTVAVIGMGTVGMIALQLSRLAGAGITVAVDPMEDRLAAAVEAGATLAITPDEDGLDKVQKLSGIGADVVIEASGQGEALSYGFRLARDRGSIVALGFYPKPVTIFLGDDFFHKELDLKTSRGTGPEPGLPPGYARWTADRSLIMAVDLIASGRLDLNPILERSVTCSFTQIGDVYRSMDSGDYAPICTFLTW